MRNQYKATKLVRVEDLDQKKLNLLWTKIEEVYKDNRNKEELIDFNLFSIIEVRDSDFEEVFRIEIENFIKNELEYIFIRGVYDRFAHFYRKDFSNVKALNNKDNISRSYKSARNKISELFEKYYTPIEEQEIGMPEIDLSIKEIDKFMSAIDGIIELMELSPRELREGVISEVKIAFSWIGLSKTSIKRIITLFKKLQEEDPLSIKDSCSPIFLGMP